MWMEGLSIFKVIVDKGSCCILCLIRDKFKFFGKFMDFIIWFVKVIGEKFKMGNKID